MKISESMIQRTILDMLYYHPMVGRVWRQNVQGIPIHGKPGKYRPAPSGSRGVSDIIGILKPSGRMLAIEVKSATGKLSTRQKAFLDQINADGGMAICARSVDDVLAALDNINSEAQ